MAQGEVLVNGPWRKWPDEKSGPWQVQLTFVEVDGRPEVVGMNLWHGALPTRPKDAEPGWEFVPPPLTWSADRHLPGPRAIQATGLRGLRVGELIDKELESMRRTADDRLRDRDATIELLGQEGAAWALSVAEALVPPPKPVGRPRKYDVAHFAEVAAVYRKAWEVPPRHPTKAVREHFTVSPALAAKWVRECRRLGLLPETQPGKAKAGLDTRPPKARRGRDGK